MHVINPGRLKPSEVSFLLACVKFEIMLLNYAVGRKSLLYIAISLTTITFSCKDDDPEPPPVVTTEDFAVTIDENPQPGAELGTITASSNKGTMTFSLKSESNPGAFGIDGTSGKISVLGADEFDFEKNTSLSAVILVKNGKVEKDVNVTVTLQKIIWEGPDLTFAKTHDADWTLAENQDKITDKVIFTRQNKGPIYNYKFWIDTFQGDATNDDLVDDFWNDNESAREFTRSGGTKGVKWAILDDTGSGTEAWDNFELYGTLGDPTHFYSFHAIASAITALQDNQNVTGIVDDFAIEVNGEAEESSGTVMPELVGKKLGIWLVEEDIYLTFSFTHWGSSGNDNGVSYTRSSKD